MNSQRQNTLDNRLDNRVINYLRISVTDRCNLACRYCVPKGILPSLSHDKIARYEEIHKIVMCASQIGISKLRITGGEPLMRKGLLTFIQSLSHIQGINEISITTNGVLLESNIDKIVESGINRVNISLDTLKPERFKFISGKDHFKTVWRGIMAALDRGLSPIKLNAVILRGINDDEIEALARLSLTYPFHVRFIEYMPMGNSDVDISQQVLIPEIKDRIEQSIGELQPVTNKSFESINTIQKNEAGPARRYKIAGALGEIGFISPVSSHFCNQCNRLRLTSTGKLRPCLLNNREIDLLTPMRQGASDDDIKEIFILAVRSKPASHQLNSPNIVDTQMSTIGG
ncbi:MAG: GTP 3',8-cyclase MoaA [Desulfamplus sp.]|nr:GTP 3',8-cyclase MoaA [Desulfamplus sp.]MBF0242339.1 GTP 3',8-cyclase MoaA [Desulfamplus sp.]